MTAAVLLVLVLVVAFGLWRLRRRHLGPAGGRHPVTFMSDPPAGRIRGPRRGERL